LLTLRQAEIQQAVVSTHQMREIENRIFAAGMPVAALMEKVGGLVAHRIQTLYPCVDFRQVGILVGPGHNGGDALVVARELHFQGYNVAIYCPLTKLKELTAQHAQYAKNLGIPFIELRDLKHCNLLIDGLFGFGLTRSLEPPLSNTVNVINQWSQPVVSIDIPSGLHTDTGEVLGAAIRAERTFCLGLWKLGLLQEQALEYVGMAELIGLNLPLTDVTAVLGNQPGIQCVTKSMVIAHLPLPRQSVTHKYKVGHLLLVCGSHRYAGGAILTGLGARASGAGMLSIAVPESLKPILTAQLPDALILGCPEINGAIARLPDGTELSNFDAIACGPGLTMDATAVVKQVLKSECPLVLDADGLNILAQLGPVTALSQRQATTVLTPHLGEFKRLFRDLAEPINRVMAVRAAAEQTGAVVLLKGARTAIAEPQGSAWINPQSTPALARGGSGDVLTGLLGGVLAQTASQHPGGEFAAVSAAWWHAQAGIRAAQERTELGVDAFTLTQFLGPTLKAALQSTS